MDGEKVNEKTPLVTKEHRSNKSSDNNNCCRSCCGGLVSGIRSISVEPCMLGISFAFAIISVFETNLMIDKICLEHYDEYVCDELDGGNFTDQQNFVQRQVSLYSSYISWVEYLPAMLAMPILSSWSDYRSKKAALLTPLIGFFLKSLIQLASCIWMNLPAWLLIIAYVPEGLTGAFFAFFMMIYIYLGSVSTHKSRTTKFSFATSFMYVTMPFSIFFSTYLFHVGGYVAVFSSQTITFLLIIIYVVAYVKDLPPVVDKSESSGSICKVISPRNLMKPLTVIVKSREGSQRVIVLIHLFIIAFLILGMGSMKYLFLYARKKFSWTYDQYNIWTIIRMPIEAVGSVIIFPISSYHFGVRDSVFGALSGISSTLYHLTITLSSSQWIFYAATAASLFSSCGFTCVRSSISKIVGSEEQSSVFSALALMETVMPLMCAPLFTLIYNTTIDVFPAAVFLVITLTSFIVFCLFIYLIVIDKSNNNGEKDIKEESRNIKEDFIDNSVFI